MVRKGFLSEGFQGVGGGSLFERVGCVSEICKIENPIDYLISSGDPWNCRIGCVCGDIALVVSTRSLLPVLLAGDSESSLGGNPSKLDAHRFVQMTKMQKTSDVWASTWLYSFSGADSCREGADASVPSSQPSATPASS